MGGGCRDGRREEDDASSAFERWMNRLKINRLVSSSWTLGQSSTMGWETEHLKGNCGSISIATCREKIVTTHQKRKLPIAAILTLPLILFLIGGLWMLFASISVSGSATLPNGAPSAISGNALGFSVAGNDECTKVEIAGCVIEFGISMISVDGVEVGSLDDDVERVALTANRDGVQITSDGRTIVVTD